MEEDNDSSLSPVMDDSISELMQRMYQEPPTNNAPQGYPKPVIQGYPSATEDVPLAMKSDFGYGSPLAALMQGDVRMYNGPTEKAHIAAMRQHYPDGDPAVWFSDGVDQFTDTVMNNKDAPILKLTPEERTNTAREALLINRMPIATLGFSPQALQYDVRKNEYLQGFQHPTENVVYATPKHDTMAHEFTHRGIERLRQDPLGSALINSMARLDPAGAKANDEHITRFILAQQGPELPHNRPGAHDQLTEANKVMGNPVMMEMLKQLEARAQQLIAERQPRGPR